MSSFGSPSDGGEKLEQVGKRGGLQRGHGTSRSGTNDSHVFGRGAVGAYTRFSAPIYHARTG